MRKGKVIAIVNQKGGVGKTTTSLNLGYSLVQAGKRVLLVDFDPQSSLTVCMGFPEPDEIKSTIAHLMHTGIVDEVLPDKSTYIQSVKGMDLIPSSIELSAIEMELVTSMSREFILKSILSEIENEYDYIIIDCGPSLGMLTINALVASDSVIIPVTPEYLSAKGLELLLGNIMRVKRKINPQLEILGIVFTRYNERLVLNRSINTIIQDVYGDAIHIFSTKIPNSIKVGESIEQGKAMAEHMTHHVVAEAYVKLANEVIQNER